jgi:site-specific DNA-methyltransferase (adenine-specific)
MKDEPKQNYQLYHGDCLEIMPQLIEKDVKVDLILTDPPYGTIKGLTLNDTRNFKKELLNWDNPIPIKPMFECCEKLLKQSRCCVLFSNNKFTFDLYMHQIGNLPYIYQYIWLKNEWGNHFMVNKAPLKKTEDIMVFRKKYDMDNNSKLRQYSKYILENIGLCKKQIMVDCGNQGLDHFFRWNSLQFSLPTKENYQKLIELYNIDELREFIPYDKLVAESGTPIFSVGDSTHKTNVLQYNKIKHGSLHPTQKPVDLLEDLIKTYTHEGDLVLDFTMGSGSTGVACMNTNRKFIGIELDENYYKIAKQRITEVGKSGKQTTLI